MRRVRQIRSSRKHAANSLCSERTRKRRWCLGFERLEKRDLLATWGYDFKWTALEDTYGDGITPDDVLAPGIEWEIGTHLRVNTSDFSWQIPDQRFVNPATYSVVGYYDPKDLYFYDMEGFSVRPVVPSTGNWGPTDYDWQYFGFDDDFVGADLDALRPVVPVVDSQDGELVLNDGIVHYTESYFNAPEISGQVFVDENMNGVRDANELRGLPGLTVFQDLDGDGISSFLDPYDITDENGFYSLQLESDPDGSQVVVDINDVEDQQAYVLTIAPGGFVPRSSKDLLNRDFGIYAKTRVSGSVFTDTNGNRKWDNGELPRPETLVFLDRNRDGRVDREQCYDFVPQEPCGISKEDGTYEIEQAVWGDVVTIVSPGIPADLFTITQKLPWVVGPSSQELSNVDFGIFQNIQLGGQVFSDTNADGVRDHYLDPFIGSADILLDIGDNGTIDQKATTDFRGVYTFYRIPPGVHRVFPSLSRDSDVTLPGSAGYQIEVNQSGNSLYALHFGIKASGELVDGKVDPIEPDEPPHDPLFLEKLEIKKLINERVNELLRFPLQRSVVEKVARFLETDTYGVPKASVPILRDVLALLNNEFLDRVPDDSTAFDVYDLTVQDVDRLKYLWNLGLNTVVVALDHPQSSWNSFWDGTYSTVSKLEHAAKSMLHTIEEAAKELRDASDRVLLEATFKTTIDLLTPATWTKLFQDLSGYESFTKSMDPKLLVDERIANYFLGVVTYFGTVDLGVASAGVIKGRALRVGENLIKEMTESASEVAEFYSKQLSTKLDDVAKGAKVWVHELDEGVLIDLNWLHETGYTVKQIEGINGVSKQLSQELGRDVYLGFRTTNIDSMRHIRNGSALPKPIDIKSKTISDIDVKYLGFDAEKVGLAGLKRPEALIKPNRNNFDSTELFNKVEQRYQQRLKEFAEIEPQINSGKFRHEANDGLIVDATTGKPFAGDIDPVYIKDATGTHLSRAEYDRAIQLLKESDALIQHGAETNIVDDVMKKVEASGIVRNSPEWQASLKKTQKLQAELERAHRNGAETIIEFTPKTGPRRGPNLVNLPEVGSNSVTSIAPKGADELSRLLQKLGVTPDEFARMNRVQRQDLIRTRVQERSMLVDDQAARYLNSNGLQTNRFRQMPANEMTQLLDAHHYGLRVAVDVQAPLSRAAIEETLVATGENINLLNLVQGSDGAWTVSRKSSYGPVLLDTDRSGAISPLDALLIVNWLNTKRNAGLLPLDSAKNYRKDTSGNGAITPLDALLVINQLNAQRRALAGGEGEAVEREHAESRVNPQSSPAHCDAYFCLSDWEAFNEDLFGRRRLQSRLGRS